MKKKSVLINVKALRKLLGSLSHLSKSKKVRIRHTAIAILAVVLVVGIFNVYNVFKQSEASSAAVPEYNIDLQIPTEGTELYRNIDKDKFGNVDDIAAAKGELLIGLKSRIPLYEIVMIANQYDLDILERFDERRPWFRLRLSDLNGTTPDTSTILDPIPPKSNGELEQIWRELYRDWRVDFVELNAILQLSACADYTSGELGGGCWPNSDPMINPPTGVKDELRQIDTHKAWKKLKTNTGSAGGNPDVWIAVIDTGVNLNHEDLINNIATDANGQPVGKNFAAVPCIEGAFEFPCKNWIEYGGVPGRRPKIGGGYYNAHWTLGHGTWTAGIAAAEGDNNKGLAGVAYNVGIVPINIADWDLFGNLMGSNILVSIKSMGYATSLSNVKVINTSTDVRSISSVPLGIVMNKAWDKGKIIVAPAGNEGENEKRYPAAYDNVIAVAAEASYTNFGKWLDITGISENIKTLGINSNNDYILHPSSGTCGAAAQVSGAIALLFSRYPNLTKEDARDITLQRPYTFIYMDGFPTKGCGIVNPGRMLTSKAPLIVWDPEETKNLGPRCVRRFSLGEKIELEWRPFPFPEGATLQSYWIRYRSSKGDGSWSDSISVGMATKNIVTPEDAEMFEDGTWIWQIGAKYSDSTNIDWTSDQTVRKSVGSKITEPETSAENIHTVKVGDKFEWVPIGNAKNYFLAIRESDGYIYHRMPLNSSNNNYTLTASGLENLQNLCYLVWKKNVSCVFYFGVVGTAYAPPVPDDNDGVLKKVKYPGGEPFLIPKK